MSALPSAVENDQSPDGIRALKLQAKDVPEQPIIDCIESSSRGLALGELYERFSEYPPKVLLAKLRAMVKKDLISAQCTCGCSGPYSPKGYWA